MTLEAPQPPIPELTGNQQRALDQLPQHINTDENPMTQATPEEEEEGKHDNIRLHIKHDSLHNTENITTENIFEVLFGLNPGSVLQYGIIDLNRILIEGTSGILDLVEWIKQFRPGITISVNPSSSINLRTSSFYYCPPEENPQYREELHIAMPESSIPENTIEFLAHLLHEFGHALQDRLEINKPLNDPENPLTEEEKYMVIQSERNATDFAIAVAKKLEELLGLSEEYGLSRSTQEILEAKLNNYQEGLFGNGDDNNNE